MNTYNVGGADYFAAGHCATTDGGELLVCGDWAATVLISAIPNDYVYREINPLYYRYRPWSLYSTDLNNLAGNRNFPHASTSADKNLSANRRSARKLFYHGRCYIVYTEFAGAENYRLTITYSDDGWRNMVIYNSR